MTNDYANLPIIAFKKLKIPLLKAFIRVSLFEIETIPKGQASQISKNKGKVEAMEAGESSILFVAYASKEFLVKFMRPNIEDCSVGY